MRGCGKTCAPPWFMLMDGNSITYGVGTGMGAGSIEAQLQPLLIPKLSTVINGGRSGYTIDQLVAVAPHPMAIRYGKLVVSIWEGTNSIANNQYTTVAGLWGAMHAWSAIYRALGAKIISPNIIADGAHTPTQNTLRLAYNDYLAQHYLEICDATLDLATEFNDPNDQPAHYGAGDVVHPSQQGNAIIAARLAPIVLSLIAT